MDEGDRRAFSARSGLLVDHPHAPRLELRDGSLNIVDAQRDVVQARTALLDVLRNRRFGAGRLEQLELRFPNRHEVRPHVLTRHFLRRFNLQPQRIAIERERRGQILYSDADVIKSRSHTPNRQTATKTRKHEDNMSQAMLFRAFLVS